MGVQTIKRDPLDIASAVAKAIKLVGAGRISEAVDKAESTVRGWADENRESRLYPNAVQIKAIDDDCMSRAGVAPCAEWLERCKDAHTRPSVDLVTTTLEAGQAVGDFQKVVAEITCPNGEGGRDLTPNEKRKALSRLSNLFDVLETAQATLVDDRGQP